MAIAIYNSRHRFGLVTITLHWVMAVAIIVLYSLGLTIDSLSYYDAWYRTLPHWHKRIGMLVLALLLVRLIWRIISPRPAPIAQTARLQRLSRWVHWQLYLLMLVALVSGYLISTADGRAIAVFNWFQVPALPALVA